MGLLNGNVTVRNTDSKLDKTAIMDLSFFKTNEANNSYTERNPTKYSFNKNT